MKTILNVALILMASPVFVCCDDHAKPVPSKWVHEGRLVVTQYNFSVGSPDPDSQWCYLDLPSIQGFKTTGFVVDSSANERFLVVVWESSSEGRLDDPSNKERFVERLRSGLPKGWAAIGEPQIEPTDVPVSGSSKVRTAIRLPGDGGLVYAYQYAVMGKRTYMLITYSSEPSEPPEFSRFVKSFAVLSSNALPPSSPLPGIFLLWALWGAIVDWRYKNRGGLRPDWDERKPYLIAAGVCLGLMVLAGVRGGTAETEGYLTAFFGTLLFALWEYGRWRIRRKNPVIAAPATQRTAENPDKSAETGSLQVPQGHVNLPGTQRCAVCGLTVLPTGDGRCPSCQRPIALTGSRLD